MAGRARTFVVLGAANAFLAVLLGAFGAHGLRARLPADLLAIFQTGVQYHQMHALGLLLVGLLAGGHAVSDRRVVASGWLLAAGIVVFSGSLYALALTGERRLGAITPLGGLCFLLGWALLAFAAATREG
jgi:uncharacterized membrane protein YgdD (TMEM256/DUF423 family)